MNELEQYLEYEKNYKNLAAEIDRISETCDQATKTQKNIILDIEREIKRLSQFKDKMVHEVHTINDYYALEQKNLRQTFEHEYGNEYLPISIEEFVNEYAQVTNTPIENINTKLIQITGMKHDENNKYIQLSLHIKDNTPYIMHINFYIDILDPQIQILQSYNSILFVDPTQFMFPFYPNTTEISTNTEDFKDIIIPLHYDDLASNFSSESFTTIEIDTYDNENKITNNDYHKNVVKQVALNILEKRNTKGKTKTIKPKKKDQS